MGKGKALLLHLLAVVAGWGIVAGLRPVVAAGWAAGQAVVEARAPAKTSARTGSPADVAAGKKLLERLSAARAEDGFDLDLGPGPPLSLQELIDDYHRRIGFDPTTPRPSGQAATMSPDTGDDVLEYHRILDNLLVVLLDGALGTDLAHSFRHGRLDALALYNSLAAHLPGPAEDDTLRVALYRHLASLDPVRAAALLQSMSEAAATRVKYETLSAAQSDALTPDTAFALFTSIPESEVGAWLNPNRALWTEATYCFPDKFGSDYLPWVEQLPAGVHRNHLAAPVLLLLRESDLPGYRRVRALVTDPEILAEFPPR